ncbi:MAG: hypothetical protein K8W52_21720 [Deltaproteobacteria bacterium]|nr:hypothetical protein [Deltaproteobacteria bacterium]
MLVAIVAGLSCSGDGGITDHHTTINGQVWWASPVASARVQAFQVLPTGDLYMDTPIAETTTAADGTYSLDIGIQGNVIELRAFGGSFVDPATGTTVTLDASVELRGYQQHIALDEVRNGAIVSPITSLQADLANARRAAKRPDSDNADTSVDRARALLGSHLLDISAENTVPADVFSPAATPAPSPTSEYRYGLVLAGMSVYASDIAAASGLTVQDFNITHLLPGLSADLTSQPDVVFDGHTNTGLARVGACPVVESPECPVGVDIETHTTCRTPCDLFANSPRAYLARAILAWLGDTTRNKSGISPDDLRSRLEAMAANREPNLFSDTAPEPLLNEGPAITFTSPNGTVTGLVDIKVTATSPVGVQSLTVDWKGQAGPALVDANPDPAVFEVHGFDTRQLGDATWTLTASASDSLGHSTTGAEHSFTVDNIGAGTISGVVWKGPISGATVKIWKFKDGAKTDLLGTGTTDATGTFSNISLQQGYSGPLLVEAGFSGKYTEEASPIQVTVDVDNVLRTVVGTYNDGDGVGPTVITPITSFATAYLGWKVANAGAAPPIDTLWNEAVSVMQAQFDIPDIEHLSPIASGSIVTLSGSARYSLVLAGLSQRALQVSSTRPGGTGDAGSFPSVMNGLAVTAKLETDIADGCWDGKTGSVDLVYGGTTKLVDTDTRIGLASAIVAYVKGPENQTPFVSAGDLLSLLDTLSHGGPSSGVGSCANGGGLYDTAGSNYDIEKPTISFSGMLDPFVRGTMTIKAVGNDHGIDLKPSTIIKLEQPAPQAAIVLPDTDGDSTDEDATVDIDTLALGEGPQTLTAESTDDSNNVGSAQHSFVVDNIAPVLSVSGVQNGDTYADNRVITFGQTDSNPGVTTATLNGAAIASGSQVTADGDYTLVVNGTDQAKNPATPLTVSFKINRMGPVITIVGVADHQYYNSARTITFSQSGTGGTISATLNGLPFTSGSSVALENDYDLVVNATNAAGLTGTSSVHFTIDTTAPVITFAGVANNGAYKQDVFITFGQNDLNKGTTTANLNNAAIGNGTTVSVDADYTLKLTATDLAGNVATPVTIAFVVDKVAPTISIAGVTNGQYYNATRTITFTAPGEPHLASLTATLNGTPFTSGSGVALDNGYTLVVTATDTAGNSSSQTVALTIDTIAPVLKYTGFTNGQFVKQDVTIVLSQVELHPGTIVATLDGATYASGTAVQAEGTHALVLNTTDLAGNVATQVLASFTIDKTAPTISVGGVANNAFYNGSKAPTFALSEPGTIAATLDGNPFTSGTSVSSEGQHTLVVNGTDKAGNAAAQVTVVFTIDTMAPTISVVGPGANNGVANNGAYNSTRVLAWSMTDANPGAMSATLKTGNGAPQPVTSPSSITAMAGVENSYQLIISGSDLAGNPAPTVTINFVVDLKAPTLSVTGVANGTYYASNPTVTVTQSDGAKVGTNAITLNGGATTSPFTTTAVVGEEKAFAVHAVPTDAAGNVGAAVDVTFYVDRKAPIIAFSGGGFLPVGTTGRWWASTLTPTFGGMVTETNLDAMTGVQLTFAGASKAAPVTGNSWTGTLASAIVDSPEINNVLVTATDLAGNATSLTLQVQADLTKPTVTVVPTTVSDERLDTFTFNANAAPNHTHVGSISLGADSTCDAARTTAAVGAQVYKYTYLLDSTTPTFATESPGRNPIKFSFQAGDTGSGAQAATGEYQVRWNNGTWSAWTSAGADASGTYSFELTRGIVPTLATVEGVFEIRFRVRDGFNRYSDELPTTRCWGNHPMAPPLQRTASTGSSVPSWYSPQLWSLTLGADANGLNNPDDDDAEIAKLLNGTSAGAAVMSVLLQNGTSEDALVSLPVVAPSYQYERDFMTTNVTFDQTSTSGDFCGCIGQANATCPAPAKPGSSVADGGLMTGSNGLNLSVRLFEVANGSPTERFANASGLFTIAKRPTGLPPIQYYAMVVTKSLPELRNGAGTYSTATLNWNGTSRPIVGSVAADVVRCETPGTKHDDSCPGAGTNAHVCYKQTTYRSFTAMMKATINPQANTQLTGASTVAASIPVLVWTGAPTSVPPVLWTSSETGLPTTCTPAPSNGATCPPQ